MIEKLIAQITLMEPASCGCDCIREER